MDCEIHYLVQRQCMEVASIYAQIDTGPHEVAKRVFAGYYFEITVWHVVKCATTSQRKGAIGVLLHIVSS